MLKGYTFSSRHDFGCNPYFVIYWMFINILKNISSNFHREMFFDSQIIYRNVIQFLNILKISTYCLFLLLLISVFLLWSEKMFLMILIL